MECKKCGKRIPYDGMLVNHIGDRMADGGVITAKKFVGDRCEAVVKYADGRKDTIPVRKLVHDEEWLQSQLCRCGR